MSQQPQIGSHAAQPMDEPLKLNPIEQPDKELDEILENLWRQGPFTNVGFKKDTKQRLNALIEKKVREARVDEVMHFQYPKALEDPKAYTVERLAELRQLQDNQSKGDV